MKRSLLVGVLAALLLLAALPAGAQDATPENGDESAQEPEVIYALAGEARGLELALGKEGLTLGAAVSRGDSSPKASGLGAGQCELLGDGTEDPEDIACNESASEKSSAPGDEGSEGETCGTPPIPAPLDTVLDIKLACGSSESEIVADKPQTLNQGRIGTLAAQLNLGGISEELEDAKDQLVDGLEELIGNLPPGAQELFDEILAVLHEGEALRANLGPVRSDIIPDGDTIEVVSTAKGAEIGLLGVPDIEEEEPVEGTANALENGLIIIEIGDAMSSAAIDESELSAAAAAKAALVRVRVLDITSTEPEPVYEEIEIAPGETQTIFADTPLESTITAADSTTEEGPGQARAASDAVSLHLLKGLEGGIQLGLARTTAAATIAQEDEVAPVEEREPLPATGGTDFPLMLLILGLAAGIAMLGARRLVRR